MSSEYIRVLIFIIFLVLGMVAGGGLLLLIFYFQKRAYSRFRVRTLEKDQKRKEKCRKKAAIQAAKEAKQREKDKTKKEIKSNNNGLTASVNTKNKQETSKVKTDQITDEPHGNRLRSRLDKKEGHSWTEFNCAADDINQETYIQKSRKKEDAAYQYAKRVHNV